MAYESAAGGGAGKGLRENVFATPDKVKDTCKALRAAVPHPFSFFIALEPRDE